MTRKNRSRPKAVNGYHLLKQLVLPPSRPKEIALHLDSYNLLRGELSSLAQTLVDWAKKADRLVELDAAIEERKSTPLSHIAGTVMQTIVAIVERFERAVVVTAWSILRDFHLAEDVAQESFLTGLTQQRRKPHRFQRLQPSRERPKR